IAGEGRLVPDLAEKLLLAHDKLVRPARSHERVAARELEVRIRPGPDAERGLDGGRSVATGFSGDAAIAARGVACWRFGAGAGHESDGNHESAQAHGKSS